MSQVLSLKELENRKLVLTHTYSRITHHDQKKEISRQLKVINSIIKNYGMNSMENLDMDKIPDEY